MTEDVLLNLELPAIPEETKVKLPCRMIKPYHRNENFVGREESLSKINEVLSPGTGPRTFRKIFTLCGSGGVGKTRTALAYVFKHMEEFQAVLWADASSQTRLLECFANFAIELGLVSSEDEAVKDPDSCKDILRRWLDTTGTFLSPISTHYRSAS
jgi:hypothetical protein